MDLAPREPGTRRHAELPFHVVGVVEQHAVRLLLVPAGAAGLLQVVLQRRGDVGVDHQPHIGLVDTHAEGVRGGDHPQVAPDEALLDVLLFFRLQSGVEAVGAHLEFGEERSDLLGLSPRRAVHDRPALCLRR